MPRLRSIVLLAVVVIVPLRGQTGFAELRSRPPGAQVFIDDSLRGTTPLFATLAVGRHSVSFRTPDGGSAQLQIEVAENEVIKHEVLITSRQILPTAPGDMIDAGFGKITVITDIPGAEVTIDRRPAKGTSPVTIEEVPPGMHIVRASVFLEKLQDRFSVAETIQVVPDHATLVRIDFGTNSTEGMMRFESNDPQLALTLRHIDSGKRYALRKPGEVRLLTGPYDIELAQDSVGVPGSDQVIRVTVDSATILYIPRYSRQTSLKSLHDHTSYVDVETFLKRSMTTRPLSETRSDLYLTQNFAWWLGGGVAMFLAAEILQSEESVHRSTTPGATMTSYRPTFSAMRGIGIGMLVAGAALTSRIDTIQVDLSFNQQSNKKDEDFLRARYADLVQIWQGQIDQDNLKIDAENKRRTAANLALPPPTVKLIPAESR